VEQPKVVGGWQVQQSGVKNNLHSIAFINDDVGVAVCADYTILRTTNGGKTWTRIMGPMDQKAARFASVVFASDKVGYVRNQFTSDVYRTADAGASWQPIKTPNEGSVYAPSGFSNHASTDGGKTWKKLELTAKEKSRGNYM